MLWAVRNGNVFRAQEPVFQTFGNDDLSNRRNRRCNPRRTSARGNEQNEFIGDGSNGQPREVAADHRGTDVMKVALSWSSGKDSAWTLHLLRQNPEIQVAALIPTFNSEDNRVAMHAVRRALVE